MIGSISYKNGTRCGYKAVRLWQVTLNKLASPHHHQTSEAVKGPHTQRHRCVCSWNGCGNELKKTLELSITGVTLIQKCLDAVCLDAAPKRSQMHFYWLISSARCFPWAAMKTWHATWLERNAVTWIGSLLHRQASHSIQTFCQTGTFTWLSLWSASSSSASSPSSFAPVAELPPKNTRRVVSPSAAPCLPKGLIFIRHHGPISDLHTTLPLWVLLIHDPLFLSPLLLLPAGLGRLLALSVRLLQEVLLHASSVPVGLLFALNAGRRT